MTRYSPSRQPAITTHYRTLKRMVTVFAVIAAIQILWAPEKVKLWSLDAAEPRSWTLSYLSLDNQKVAMTVPAPHREFVEGRAIGTISVQMTLPQCASYKSYRFWVGGHRLDSTMRQPTEWSVFVRGEDGDWIKTDSEEFKGEYKNSRWYSFPLRSSGICISQVRVEITKLADKHLFRLYRFQLFNPKLLDSLKEMLANFTGVTIFN